jgi:four helix bundle protein
MQIKGDIIRAKLIDFAVTVSEIGESLGNSDFGNILRNQMIRSSISASLNQGEAQSASSPRELVYKLKLVLKEVRETRNALEIINKKNIIAGDTRISTSLQDADELCAMLYSSIRTAMKSSQSRQ